MKLFAPFIYIVLSVALFFMFISPNYRQNKVLQSEIKLNQETIENANKLRDEQTKLQEKNAAISPEERERLEKILPEAVDNVGLVLDISKIGSFTVIKNIAVGGEVSGEKAKLNNTSENSKFGTIQLGFSFTASYENLKLFIRKLEDSLRLVDITNMDISPVNNQTGEPQYNVNIKLNTYWLR